MKRSLKNSFQIGMNLAITELTSDIENSEKGDEHRETYYLIYDI